MEVGPFRLHQDRDHLEINNGSWHKHANLLFVDQPVGTGFSLTNPRSYVKELPDMASSMIIFLEKYFEIFPERQNDEFYLAGESYAGQYIPYLARAILDKNLNKTSPFMKLVSDDKKSGNKFLEKKNVEQSSQEWDKQKDTETWLDLKAVLIGNGWIDPLSQYLSYLPFAYQSGIIKHGSSVAATVESKHKECIKWYESNPNSRSSLSVDACEAVLESILKELYLETGLSRQDPNACLNMYDIRLRDQYSSCGMNWPPDISNVISYLHRKDVLEALHLPSTVDWKECNGPVGLYFKAKHSSPSIRIIPTLIEDNIQVVMFNGDQDLICNHLGNERLINTISWGPEVSSVGSPNKRDESNTDKDKENQKEGDKDSENDKKENKDKAVSGEKSSEQIPPVVSVTDVAVPGLNRETGFRSGEMIQDWYVDGSVAGKIQSGRNLTYIKIFNASHMVPFDLPMVGQAMIHQFLRIPGSAVEHSKTKAITNAEKGGDDKSWRPYYKAGVFVLVFCIISALFLGLFVWRNRKVTYELHDSDFAHKNDEAEPLHDGNQRPRSVHYEDELDDYEAGRLTTRNDDDYDGRESRGFFQSILAGMSRWNHPRKATQPLKLHEYSNRDGRNITPPSNNGTGPRRGGLKKSSIGNPTSYRKLTLSDEIPGINGDDMLNEHSLQLDTFHDSPNEDKDETGNLITGKSRDSLDSIFEDSDHENDARPSRSVTLV